MEGLAFILSDTFKVWLMGLHESGMWYFWVPHPIWPVRRSLVINHLKILCQQSEAMGLNLNPTCYHGGSDTSRALHVKKNQKKKKPSTFLCFLKSSYFSSRNSTAVCIYSVGMIEEIFENSTFKGYNKDIPRPRPGTVKICFVAMPRQNTSSKAFIFCFQPPYAFIHIYCGQSIVCHMSLTSFEITCYINGWRRGKRASALLIPIKCGSVFPSVDSNCSFCFFNFTFLFEFSPAVEELRGDRNYLVVVNSLLSEWVMIAFPWRTLCCCYVV